MKTMTKLLWIGLGAIGLAGVGIGGYYGQRAIRRRRALAAIDRELAELDEPFVVAEEVVVVTEPDTYFADVETR